LSRIAGVSEAKPSGKSAAEILSEAEGALEIAISQKMVGATGFEPVTPCAQGRCATRLRYAPTG
jgi:hypothetical protein